MKDIETLVFHGIDKWHELGYKGKGINFLELEGEENEHGLNVIEVFKMVAPEAKTFLHGKSFRTSGDIAEVSVVVGEDRIDLKKFVRDNGIHIIGLSQENASGGMNSAVEKYFNELNVILVGSAGNNGIAGVTGLFENVGIMVGAIEIVDGVVKRERYSGYGEDTIDFATLHGNLEGTSFSSPVLAGMIALIFQRYGNIPQLDMEEVLKSISIDAGVVGFDTSFGWGVPVLPDAVRMLEPINNGFLTTNSIHHTPLIQERIIDFTNRQSYPMQPKFLTTHNFGTNHIAENVSMYIVNYRPPTSDDAKSWHFTVGKNVIYQHMSIYQNGWHAGDGLDGTGNRDSIGIEVEENLESMINAVRLIVYLRQLLGDLENKFHQDWSGKYCPRWILQNVGKAEFIKMIEVMEMKFKDVEESKWSFKAIDYVTNKGLMKGFPDGTFKPKEPLTREQMAQVLYNLGNSTN